MEKFWKNSSDRVHSSVKLQAAGVQFAKNKILNNHCSRILLKLQAFVFYMFITKEQKFSRPSFNGYFRFVVISGLYATVILILGRLHQLSVMYRYCYTKVNSAWTTKVCWFRIYCTRIFGPRLWGNTLPSVHVVAKENIWTNSLNKCRANWKHWLIELQ